MHPEFLKDWDYTVDPYEQYSYSENGIRKFPGESGQDYYYVLYAHFLKKKNGIEKYAKQRKILTDIYSNINLIFANIHVLGRITDIKGIVF